MITKTMKWVSISALLLVVLWRPSASYQLPLGFVTCAGAALVVLALFSIKRGIETYVDNRFNSAQRVTVKALSVGSRAPLRTQWRR